MNLGTNELIKQKYKTSEETLKFMEQYMVDGRIPYRNEYLKEKQDFLSSLNGNYKDLSKLKKFFTYVDLINSNIEDFIVCQKGCAFCCKIPVQISELEVKYIERNTKYKRQDIKDINVNEYCPFLDKTKGICSIYEFRPLVCRTFFTFDNPSYCEEGKKKHIVSSLDTNPHIVSLYALLLDNTNCMPYQKDIRNYFSNNLIKEK